MHWLKNPEELKAPDTAGMIYWNSKGIPELKYYLNKAKGVYVSDFWDDVSVINSMAQEYLDYPTRKPKELLARIVNASSSKNDIVIDAFAGSGTTAAVAEKLGRRWIAMDCGKLAIYTTQKRLLSLPRRSAQRRRTNVQSRNVLKIGMTISRRAGPAASDREGSQRRMRGHA